MNVFISDNCTHDVSYDVLCTNDVNNVDTWQYISMKNNVIEYKRYISMLMKHYRRYHSLLVN